MNRITKADREALIAQAQALRLQDLNWNQCINALMTRENVSRDRARHAVATATMRERGQARQRGSQ